MKTAKLAFEMFFLNIFVSAPGYHHLEIGDLLLLLKASTSSLIVTGSQLVINWLSICFQAR